MNLIFLTMSPFYDLDAHNIYADLLKEFVLHGHKPYLVSPCERKNGLQTELSDKGEYAVLRVRIGNTSNVSFIEKGISTVLLEKQYIRAIQKHLSDVVFGLILYSTPPVTLANVVRYLKNTYGAPTYLLLKDIFPQNAVDLGMMKESGLIYRYFRQEEKRLYALSDSIGCMSQANVDYVVQHNPEVNPDKVHVNPNSICPVVLPFTEEQRSQVRVQYGIPRDAVVFMYGGNLGKPQDIPYVVACLRTVANRSDCYFVVCGTGSEYCLLEEYVDKEKPSNITLINGLPKDQYDGLLQACDVGMIFLDHRFTIPNFPSRMLSYMERSLPVLACTDTTTDIGKVIVANAFGWWCESNSTENFANTVNDIMADRKMVREFGKYAAAYLANHYVSSLTCDLIELHHSEHDEIA